MANYSDIVREVNPYDVPMCTTAFYKHLKEEYTGYRLQDIQAYLETFGFVHGVDKVDRHTLKDLRIIHDNFFYNEIEGMPTDESSR